MFGHWHTKYNYRLIRAHQSKKSFTHSNFVTFLVFKNLDSIFSDSFLSIFFRIVRDIEQKNSDFQKWVNNTLKALNMSSVVKALDEGK